MCGARQELVNLLYQLIYNQRNIVLDATYTPCDECVSTYLLLSHRQGKDSMTNQSIRETGLRVGAAYQAALKASQVERAAARAATRAVTKAEAAWEAFNVADLAHGAAWDIVNANLAAEAARC